MCKLSDFNSNNSIKISYTSFEEFYEKICKLIRALECF